MPLVQEVVNWAIANADNIKPIPPSPAGKQYPARPNQSMQEMMGAIARWRDDIDAAIAAAATSGLTVTPTPAADQVVLWADAGTTVYGDPALDWDPTFQTLVIGDGVTANSGRLNLRADAAGNPQVSLRQNNSARAIFGYLDIGDILNIDSVIGSIDLMTGSTTALRINTGQNTEVINQFSVSDVIGNNRLRITASGTNGIINYANNGPFKLQQNSADRITLNNDAEVLINTGGRLVAGDVSATTGASVIEGNYSGTSRLFVAGSTRSAGRSYLARGVRADVVTANGYESSADNVAFARGAFEVGGDTFHWLGAASATVAIGTDVTMNERMKLEANVLTVGGGSGGPAIYIDGSAASNPFMQFRQAGSNRAYIQYLDTGDELRIQTDGASGDITLYPGNVLALTLDSTTQHATFAQDVIQGGFRISDVEDGIFFEDDKHAITWNDGQGNFNIRVGNRVISGAEECTEAGYATHIEWAQSTGEIQFNVSSASLAVGPGAITWWKQISILPTSVSLRYSGNESLITRSDGVDVGRTGLTTPVLGIVSTATGNPKIEFNQTTTLRAYLQYLDSGDIFRIDSDGEVQIASNNTVRATWTTAGDLVLSENLEVRGQAWSPVQTLTQAATIAWDCDLGNSAVTTMTGNRTLGAPTNQKAGATYTLRVIQDATGTRTLAYNAVFKWPGGLTPVLSTGGSDIDILTFVSDGTNMYGVIQKDFT